MPCSWDLRTSVYRDVNNAQFRGQVEIVESVSLTVRISCCQHGFFLARLPMVEKKMMMEVVLCHGFYQSMQRASEPPGAGWNDSSRRKKLRAPINRNCRNGSMES